MNEYKMSKESSLSLRKVIGPGAWLVQSAKRPTLDSGSVHELGIVALSPVSGSILSMEPP